MSANNDFGDIVKGYPYTKFGEAKEILSQYTPKLLYATNFAWSKDLDMIICPHFEKFFSQVSSPKRYNRLVTL